MQISLVSTVFNEMSRLDNTIRDIEVQTHKPSEIIITDAGSTDGTYERLLQWKRESPINIKILQEKRCNVARGRNLAIAEASHRLIASTDFGCRFHPEWLASIVAPFTENPDLKVSGGAFSVNEAEIQTTAAKADYILQAGYPVVMDEYFSVSSRSIAYKKEVWEQIGGYNEWLTLAADDTIFWRQIKDRGFKYLFVDKPYVYWGRHKTAKQFAKEAFRYGLGDGESKINFRNFISNTVETGLRYSIPLNIIIFLWWISPAIYLQTAFLLLQLTVGTRSYRNAYGNWRKLRSEKYGTNAFLYALKLIEQSRYYYIKAYLKGWLFSSKQIKKERMKLHAQHQVSHA